MYLLKQLAALIATFACSSLLHSQAVATASRSGDAQIGIGYSYVSPDYTPNHFNGMAAYADFDFTPHLGVEAEFHYAKNGGSDPSSGPIYEKTYEIGGRYFRTYGRLNPYVKAMYGRGVFNFPYNVIQNPDGSVTSYPVANLAYNLVAGGLGVDYNLLRRVNVRAEYEYQHWFGFPPSGLTPSLITLGVAYHFQ